MINRLVGERDYSAQGVCHLLLGLLLQEDSRVVRSVDCRLPEQHNRPLEFSENDQVIEQKRTAYEKYLERPENLEGVSYFEFLERWNPSHTTFHTTFLAIDLALTPFAFSLL